MYNQHVIEIQWKKIWKAHLQIKWVGKMKKIEVPPSMAITQMLIKNIIVVYCFSTLIPFSLQIRFLSMLSWLIISYIFIGQKIEFSINHDLKIYITRGLKKE